jgi:hypothetical protein
MKPDSRRYDIKHSMLPQAFAQMLSNPNIIKEINDVADEIDKVVGKYRKSLTSPQVLSLQGSEAYSDYIINLKRHAIKKCKEIISKREFPKRLTNLKTQMIPETKVLTTGEKQLEYDILKEVRGDIRANKISELKLRNRYITDCESGDNSTICKALETWPGGFGPIKKEQIEKYQKIRLEKMYPQISDDIRQLEAGVSLLEDLVGAI